MGAHPYWYFVPFRPEVQDALDALRTREFEAGRYNPVIPFPQFMEPVFYQQHPGRAHPSIQSAVESTDADGTRSILDIARIASTQEHGAAAAVPDGELLRIFGTTAPSRADVEASMGELFALVERGCCLYVVTHNAAHPEGIWFGGYSFD